MKKTALAVCATASIGFVAAPTFADTLFGVYAGGGHWNTEYSGDIGQDGINVEQDLDLSDKGNNFFYIAIEHPVPLFPNIKLQRTDLETDGDGSIKVASQFNDVFFEGNVATHIDLSHTDITLYYEILDNWVNLDVGVTARLFDGGGQITGQESLTLTKVTDSVDIDDGAPMLYVKAQFDLPFTGLSIGADINALGYSGDTLTDYTARVSYLSDIVPMLEVGLEVGYRSMQLKLEDIGDLETDFTIEGPYASIIFHF